VTAVAHTLEEIEEILAVTAEEAAQEYVDGEYGDPDDWTKTGIISAELKGDPGDRLIPEDAQVFAMAVAEAFIRQRRARLHRANR
jgi:hypothetical protein